MNNDQQELDAAMAGVGPAKSWYEAYKGVLHVTYVQALRIEALEAANQRIVAIVRRHLQEQIDEQNTVKRMNRNRIGDKSHQKYQPEIDRLSAMLNEIEAALKEG